MSLFSDGQLQAPKGKYRVVGVDTYEAPDADYLVGDFETLASAIDAANREGRHMNPCYVYDDDGELCHSTGRP